MTEAIAEEKEILRICDQIRLKIWEHKGKVMWLNAGSFQWCFGFMIRRWLIWTGSPVCWLVTQWQLRVSVTSLWDPNCSTQTWKRKTTVKMELVRSTVRSLLQDSTAGRLGVKCCWQHWTKTMVASSRGGEGFGSGRFYISVYTSIFERVHYAGS